MNFYILAGGKSTRLGPNKALLKLGSRTIIEKIISAIPPSAEGVKIVSNIPEDYAFLHLPVIGDIHPGCGPISGVHAGLVDSESFFSFFLASDLPSVSRDLIEAIIAHHRGEDILCPRTRRGLEPLCSIYSKSCIPTLEDFLRQGRHSLQEVFREITTSRAIEVVDEEALFNLNTVEDWERLHRDSAPSDSE